MDESENESTKSELSDSWMVINENPSEHSKDNGTPSDGSDGESVEVIDQEECDEVLTGETDYDAVHTDEELNGPKNKKYVHHPNEDVNAALNRLMVIAASIVVGLAVGHYLGYSEEMNDMSSTLKKLQAENVKLKNHICMTLENYHNHIIHIPGTAYRELNKFNENYAVFLTVLLNLTCPHTSVKILDLQTSLADIRQALLEGRMSDDELYGRIGKILEVRSNEHDVIDYMKISDEAQTGTVTTEDKGLSSTVSQITETAPFKEHYSETHLHAESLTVKTQGESSSKKEKLDYITGTSNFEHLPVRGEVEAKAVKSELSEGLTDLLAKSPSEIYEGFQEATDSKYSPDNKEVPNKNMLKHIVKDVVQEITESLLALHHDDIIRDIRNEAKKLTESFPLFKSALLLNMEVTGKLKSHLKYIKDMLYSVLENSLHLSDKGKIDEIFSSVNLHSLHLEKAMDSLRLIEVTLNPKRTGTLNVERSNVCTVSDFLKDNFINIHDTHTMENNRKHSNDPYKQENKYTANQSPSGTTVENLSQKSTMESDEKIVNLENLQKIEEGNNKSDRRQTHDVKESKKKKQDHNNKKGKKSKTLSVETKQYNEKDEGKYKNFKTMKDKHHDQEKKSRKQNHYKEEKSFKNEEYNRRKKNSYNMYKWDKDSDYRHSNMSGDWVSEMNRARAESRENEHKSDWLFERAYARKAKRNGKWDVNNWYFQRAEGRKSCRQKSCNEKNKFHYSPPNDSEKQYHDNNNKQHQKQKKYFNPKRWISKAYMTVSKFRF